MYKPKGREEVKQKVYQTPELLHIGSAKDVVLGVEAVGGDVFGELNFHELEFQED